MLWEYLFAKEMLDESAGETLREVSSIHGEHAAAKDRQIANLEERVAKLELALEATARTLELRAGIRREELALMVQQIDLADGVEDGRVGPDRAARAPRCPHCDRPVNPKREQCVYCDGPLTAGVPGSSSGPYRGVESMGRSKAAGPPVVECTQCGVKIRLDQSDLSVHGVVCPPCSKKVNR